MDAEFAEQNKNQTIIIKRDTENDQQCFTLKMHTRACLPDIRKQKRQIINFCLHKKKK